MKFNAAFKFSLLSVFISLANSTSLLAGMGPNNGESLISTTTVIIIGILAAAAIFGSIPLLTRLKARSAAKIVTHAAGKDSFWNAAELKKHAERTFYSIQDAWENRNMDKVQHAVSKELYLSHKNLLDLMIARQEKNILTQIQIDEIRIIGCEDHIDDSKDRYIAYIQGRLLDYVLNESTEEIIKNSSKILRNISESYHFVRSNNSWILEKIDTDVTMQDLIQTKNSFEA